MNDPLDNSDVGDLTNTDSDNTLDLGFMMVLSNDSIGAPVLCFAVSIFCDKTENIGGQLILSIEITLIARRICFKNMILMGFKPG